MTSDSFLQDTAIDPVTFSVILNRFKGIAEEMSLTLEMTAWSSLLALDRDFSCAIYDWDRRQLCMYDALPIHTTSLQLVLEEIARSFGDDLRDGDVIIANAPHRGNTHIGDLVTATPVFVDDRPMFWAVTKGHQMDTGAMSPTPVLAYARDVWQEGIQIPPVKLVDQGRVRHDVLDLYLSNVRYREPMYGDLLAQLGSINTGKLRLRDLCDEYGVEAVGRYAGELLAYADRRMAAEIDAIPDGVYQGETWVDTDAFEAFHIPVRVTVTVDGDRIVADFSASGEQGAGGLNGSFATSQAAGAIPFLTYVDPAIPHNHGALRHIEVVTRKGTICDAEFPASTSVATLVPSDAMQDAIQKAMVSALPGRVLAGTYRNGAIGTFTGVDSTTGEPWGTPLFQSMGGQGAGHELDGWPLFEYGGYGGVRIHSIEEIELASPIAIDAMEIEPDSMGFGQWIGGPGIRMAVRPLRGGMDVFSSADGVLNPPHGVLGGTPGIGGGQYVETSSGRRTYVVGAGRVAVNPDERWVGVSTGGGGYGHAWARDPELVRRDVRDGFITRDVARTAFGVALSADVNPAVDPVETAELRARLAAQRPRDEPEGPGSARWLEDNLRPGDRQLVNPR